MDYTPAGSSVHGIFQARILEWVAISFSIIIGNWNAKVGYQEIPGVTGKFGLGLQNEAGQRLLEFCQENAQIIANTFFQTLEPIIQSEVSQKEKHQYSILTHIYGI